MSGSDGGGGGDSHNGVYTAEKTSESEVLPLHNIDIHVEKKSVNFCSRFSRGSQSGYLSSGIRRRRGGGFGKKRKGRIKRNEQRLLNNSHSIRIILILHCAYLKVERLAS